MVKGAPLGGFLNERGNGFAMKKIALAAAAVCLMLTGQACAGCSNDELQVKVQAFGTKLTALAQKNAQKAVEIGQKVQAEAPQVKSADEACMKYDEWTALVDKAS
jgi:hypothetical protein